MIKRKNTTPVSNLTDRFNFFEVRITNYITVTVKRSYFLERLIGIR